MARGPGWLPKRCAQRGRNGQGHARRDDPVQHAQDAGAAPALVDGLRQIPGRQDDSAGVVITEMSDVDQD
jgi:hypothetical protein